LSSLADLTTTELVLAGTHVRLEPLTLEDAEDLFAIAQDDEIWRWLPAAQPRNLKGMEAWVTTMLGGRSKGTSLPFIVRDPGTGAAMGTTSYLGIVPEHRQVEIGWTWYARPHWRTAVNTECKYLLLRHAFEELGCIRVYLTTDLRNERSQRAIERLGAVREGVLRKYRVLPTDGYHRSSVMHSVIDDEWHAVKTRLEGLMAAPRE
jgi:N-acetyltransferase